MQKRNKAKGTHSIESQADPEALEVTFTFDSGEAEEVEVCGDFNQWSPGALCMIRLNGDSHWEKRLILTPGRYEYKFLVDGEWISDPKCKEVVANAFGSTNSVVVVRPLEATRTRGTGRGGRKRDNDHTTLQVGGGPL